MDWLMTNASGAILISPYEPGNLTGGCLLTMGAL